MDSKPFLTLRFDNLGNSDVKQLFRFRYDKFRPEALRTLAEESIYLTTFTKTISSSLREIDQEFVRYVAGRSNVERQLNQRFIDSITPLVKQAVEKAVSAMVVSGLSTRQNNDDINDLEKETEQAAEIKNIVDPNNPNIVTTVNELTLLERVKEIIGIDSDLQGKDTESYFSVLHEGKTNRWLLRFYDKKNMHITFPISLSDIQLNEINRARLVVEGKRIIISKPDEILKISGIVMDAYEYVKNDQNFKRSGTTLEE